MGHVYNLKNSLKFKLLAFCRKYTPFIDQKCTYEKWTKNLGRALPPTSFGQNPNEQLLFFGRPSLTDVMKTLPSFLFPRQEIYEAAKLTKAEVTTFHRKAVDLIERASGSPMIF